MKHAINITLTSHKTLSPQVPEVPGDQAVNSVLGDVFSSCGQHTSQPSGGDTSEPDLGAVYRYIGALLAEENSSEDIPAKLNGLEIALFFNSVLVTIYIK